MCTSGLILDAYGFDLGFQFLGVEQLKKKWLIATFFFHLSKHLSAGVLPKP